MRTKSCVSCVVVGICALLPALVTGNGVCDFALAQEAKIAEIRVLGNRAVQAEAIRGLMQSRVGSQLNLTDIRSDIRAIFKSGFFQDVRIEKTEDAGNLVLIVEVVEKPSISEIKLEGFSEVSASNVNEKLQTKRYTIVDEKKLNADVRTIEQMYVEKGYYLAKVSYTLEPQTPGDVKLIFKVIENNPVSVGRVNVIGNSYFSDTELKNGLLTSERRWVSWLTNSGSFRDEFVTRDKEYISYIYKDNGFIEADVAAPQSRLDPTRQRVDVGFAVDEGQQFHVGTIRVTGDLLKSEDEILNKLALKRGNLFRISQFQSDVLLLKDMYGDAGYAAAYVYPKQSLNRETRLVDIEWEIKKGEKYYFNKITVEGNSKTRDNVIRRAVKVSEGDLFNSTRLKKSEEAVERLGFFSEVNIQKELDNKEHVVNLIVKVKEKSTGSLSASIGASPGTGSTVNFMGQGAYSESNFRGKGWETNVSANVSKGESTTNPNWGLNLSFTEPSIDDGPWSVTVYGKFDFEYSKPFENEPERSSRRKRAGISVGREIVEDLRFNLGYSYERVQTDDINPIYRFSTEVGDTERLTQSLTFDKTNNFRTPTSGYYLSASNTFALRLFGGEHYFGKAEASAVVYVPFNFSDDFQTNFRFAFEPGYVYPLAGHPIPTWERFRLGNMYNMRAYQNHQLTPEMQVVDSPFARETVNISTGGNRRIYGSAEYFLPLIPEANLRFVTFGEVGGVYAEQDAIDVNQLKYDVGLGIRWTTPIAPFRFEWAWPLSKRKLGESEFIFTIGADNASSF